MLLTPVPNIALCGWGKIFSSIFYGIATSINASNSFGGNPHSVSIPPLFPNPCFQFQIIVKTLLGSLLFHIKEFTCVCVCVAQAILSSEFPYFSHINCIGFQTTEYCNVYAIINVYQNGSLLTL